MDKIKITKGYRKQLELFKHWRDIITVPCPVCAMECSIAVRTGRAIMYLHLNGDVCEVRNE